MSRKAIGKDGKEHFADDLQDLYNGPYFCPGCGVEMRRKNLGTESKKYHDIQPYFSATRGKPHKQGCDYGTKCLSRAALEAQGFQADDFFKGLTLERSDSSGKTPGGGRDPGQSDHKENRLTTLNQLYLYCLQHSDDDTLPDGTKIYEIFQDERNANRYKPRKPFRMIRLKFDNANRKYSDKYNCYAIWCLFPPNVKEDEAKKYRLRFQMGQEKLFEDLSKKLAVEKRRQGELFILVGGEWDRNACWITSKKQIFILNKRKK